jgi:hypothetical protein
MTPRPLLAAALLALAPAAARAQDDDENLKARLGKFRVEERGYYTRLMFTGTNTLFGTQINNNAQLHRADIPMILGSFSPWDTMATSGTLVNWNPRLEPLSYYHRNGPLGAVFYHLRTRNDGKEAAAPVGVSGLYAGTPAAYALRGQSMTFYSVHREPRELVERTDQYFTFLHDARDRGAKLDFRYGPVRETLAADVDKRFALLIVEMVEEGYEPGDRLTLEAVRLYIDRTLPGGVVALHTSNKFFRLEPVVERIVRELKLSARVWNDDSENRPGKTASSWVVLARSEADLGPLAKPTLDQILTFGTRNEPLLWLLEKYGPDTDAMGAILKEWGGPEAEWARLTPQLMSIRQGPQAAILYQSAIRLRDASWAGADATLGALSGTMCGTMFRRLAADPRVELRTDAHRPDLPALPPPPPPKK